MDHPYFLRQIHGKRFRLIRGGLHCSELLERPADRYEMLVKEGAPKPEPRRTGGRTVVVVGPSPMQRVVTGMEHWEDETVARLREITDRPVVVRQKYNNGSFREFMQKHDAWALVGFASGACLEAALLGYPVFSTPRCCSWPISAGPIENIETPERRELEPLLHSLAYAQWHLSDLRKLNLEDYDYTCAS